MEIATKAQIFARYLGQQIKITAGKDRKLIAVGGIDDELYIKLRLGEAGSKQFVHAEFLKENTASLLLTPLSAITDQDAIEVAKLTSTENHGTITRHKNACEIEIGDDHLREVMIYFDFELEIVSRETTSCFVDDYYRIDSYSALNIFQYLQCRGYALPQTVIENGKPVTYTVEQLIEAGVFKLMDGKEETK